MQKGDELQMGEERRGEEVKFSSIGVTTGNCRGEKSKGDC